MEAKSTKIKKRITRNINILTPDAAIDILKEQAELRKRLINHGNKIIVRLITGGFWSQSLDAMVMRKLGERAGWIKS